MSHSDTLTDARESMRKAESQKAALCIITAVRSKLEEAKFIRFGALVQSLQREHDDAVAIAKSKGFTV